MSPSHSVLGRAFAASLLLHAILIAAGARLVPSPGDSRRVQAALSVWLHEEAAPPQLSLPEARPVQQAPKPRPAPERAPKPSPGLNAVQISGEAASAAHEQLMRELLYPLEAVEQGLEGDVVVLAFLDGRGNVVASRIERSSGHRILDDAAIRAVRTLRALPDNAPREALVPVRFRLR